MKVAITFPSDPTTRHSMIVDRQLGRGKFQVYLVKSPELNREYALKVFSREFALQEFYKRERKYIEKLEHANIIKHVPVLSHNFRLNIILTEYTPNGDFFDFVSKGYLQHEKLVRSYFYQLMSGLEYLHSQEIAHFDLKLENLLLDENYTLKIIDFDQAHHITEERRCSVGTTGYRPPEVIDNTCEDFFAADVYAAGIILYAFKACEFPFVESDDPKVKEVEFYDQFVERNEEFWKEKEEKLGKSNFFDKDFKELLNGMLCKDPKQRMTLQEIKNSAWFKGPVYTSEELQDEVKKIIENVSK